MIKKIIALVATLLAVWAMVYIAGLDSSVHKLDKISALIKSTAMEDSKLGTQAEMTPIEKAPAVVDTSSKDKEVEDKLKALREKAGNIAAFNVSPLYKKSCASCHGNVGQGIIGPKLIGQSAEVILKDLQEFKSGARKNYVMYGLLGNMTDEQLQELATEIGTFQTKLDEATK
jgi:cytochrome c553